MSESVYCLGCGGEFDGDTDPYPLSNGMCRECVREARRPVASILAENERLRAEVERLKREGTPGVMHKVDQAFHDLAIKERDYERARVDRLEAENERLRTRVGLPDDLWRVLNDQSIVVSQDASVFELIAKWQNAPSNTASADDA